MKTIEVQKVQALLDEYTGCEMYLHLETTNGSYAALRGESEMSVCAYFETGKSLTTAEQSLERVPIVWV